MIIVLLHIFTMNFFNMNIFTMSGVLALHMQAACHSQSIKNTVFIFGNRALSSEK